ncbi:N-acetyl-gamma-glutamyl-phosphate reductase [Formosa agariphila KMM 3901]|uniref:N-acetyl-gamma-glutamyl-phosphate reductase n=1 Tax=Formosa agariphila (strain DSM 15362 / KCTC 12365 / LMG 23005 / KMM 3901 / M-2Alg 35-1) TaxID=1347342 RepID=T2KM14_FORAG|nr:translocation/assembly module TamB domain-containing protein [Formosa agariphila]CDF79044.1 N-acetyl-gamma-glutamyl-phosphate reductase [Formosa agariphila KMM 3901]
MAAIILLLFIILILILAIPGVQTRLGKYATSKLNESFDTHINIGAVGLHFNGDVQVKHVYIEDYRQDTLISAKLLETHIVNFRNLYNGRLVFSEIELTDLDFNIKTYKDEEQTNLDVFVARFDNDNNDDTPSNFLLSSSDVSIYNGRFTFVNENLDTPEVMVFNDITINGSNFLIHGPKVSTRINTLEFTDSRGLHVENMSTNFAYTLNDITFANLDLRTEESTLKGDVRFEFNREDLSAFTDKVQVNANITSADVAFNDLNYFYNEFGVNQSADFSVLLTGTLNDLNLDGLNLKTNRGSRIIGDFNFKNLFNRTDNSFYMNGQFSRLSSNYRDLITVLPKLLGQTIPSNFERFGNFNITGTSEITTSRINADLRLNTALGLVESDLVLTNINNIDLASYKGNIRVTDFDLGTFIDQAQFGNTSLDIDVDGSGFTKESVDTKVNGEVFYMVYNNYSYHDINVLGNFKSSIYNGNLVSNDPNFKLDFNGAADFSNRTKMVDFVADVQYADLKALNFVKRDTLSMFKGIVEIRAIGTSINDVEGLISISDANYLNEHDNYIFDDFTVTSVFRDSIRHVTVDSPDIVEGEMSGVFRFRDIETMFRNSIGTIYSNFDSYPVQKNQYLDFNFTIYNKIVEVFYPNIALGKNTFISGHVQSNQESVNFKFKSPEIKLYDYFASDIEIDINNTNPLFNTYIEIDSIYTKFYDVSRFSLVNKTINDTLFMRTEFQGGTRDDDVFNLNFYHTINAENNSVFGFKKSDVTFKNNTWLINADRDTLNKIEFSRDLQNISIDKLAMSLDDELISLEGFLVDSTSKDLKLTFDKVDLEKVTPKFDSLNLGGILNGKVDIVQKNGNYIPSSDVSIDFLEVNGFRLGSFSGNITGNENLTRYFVNAKIKNDSTNSFSAIGYIDALNNQSYIDVDLLFDNFDLKPFSPLGKDVISDIRGFVSGNAKLIGDLNKPAYEGVLNLNEAGLLVPLLNTNFNFDNGSRVLLKNQEFTFDDIKITDNAFNTKGVLGGFIKHNNFSEWVLGLDIKTDRLLVLNTPYVEDALYYGTGYIGGSASIKGPTEELSISVIGETKPGTVFKIPMNDSESFGDNTFIHFLSPEEKQAKLEGKELFIKDIKGLELDFDLEVNKNAEIEIVMDRDSGSTIKGRGIGGLLIEINTNGKFNIYGDFSVFQGVYNFMYGGIVQKEFTVEPGGTLAWDGDPLGARIDLKAIYKTQANPSPLLDNPINKSIPVNVEIELTEQLEKPEVNFGFEFPNVNSTVKSELTYRLESKEDRDNQALYLLTTGSFSSGLTSLNPYGTLTERLNGIVNGLFSESDNKLNIGLNYELGENNPDYQTDDRFGVTLQTKISERVMINGNVDVPVGGVSQTVIAGDIEVNFLLNEEGTLTANVFNRENSIQDFGDKVGYTQGVGISYNIDFDTFRELIQKIFYGEMNKSEGENSENETPKPTGTLPAYIIMKTDISEE